MNPMQYEEARDLFQAHTRPGNWYVEVVEGSPAYGGACWQVRNGEGTPIASCT